MLEAPAQSPPVTDSEDDDKQTPTPCVIEKNTAHSMRNQVIQCLQKVTARECFFRKTDILDL